jgi:hypothetical protein
MSDAPPAWAGRRVVLVHDWLTGMRGGEKVLEAVCRLFPSADLCTLVHARGSVSQLIESRRIRTSPLQWFPQSTRRYREMLPLFPAAIELFDLDDADLVISTSHCAAKSVVRTGRARHLCYCHSPMRYAWDQFNAYFGPERVGRAGNVLARLALPPLRGGIVQRRTGSIATSPTRSTLPGGSRGTIIAKRQCCIHRWTRSSSRLQRRRPHHAFSWYQPSCPTSGSMLR